MAHHAEIWLRHKPLAKSHAEPDGFCPLGMGQRKDRIVRLYRDRLNDRSGPGCEWREVESQTGSCGRRVRFKRNQERSSELSGERRLRIPDRRWQVELRARKHC